MSWFLVAGTAVTVVSGAASQRKAKKKALEGARDENSARAKANVANAVRSGYREGLLNVQEAQYKKAAAQQGYDVGAASLGAMGEVSANAAASGSIGASVDAVSNDIAMRLGEFAARQEEALDVDNYNRELQSQQLAFDAEASQVGYVRADVASENEILVNAAIQGGSWALSTYGAAKHKLNPGGAMPSQPTPTGSTKPLIMPDP